MRATIELAHALGLRVIAEGVEDAATFNVLRGMGCDLAQGLLHRGAHGGQRHGDLARGVILGGR